MIIRDFYFCAWLIVQHHYDYRVQHGKVRILGLDKRTLTTLKREYVAEHKFIFDKVKQIVREANQSRIQYVDPIA